MPVLRRVFSPLAAIAPASLALALACSPNPSASGPATAGAPATEKAPQTPASALPPTAMAPPGEGACDKAALTLTADSVVASINDEPLRYGDLGPGLKAAEDEALRTYCNTIHGARQEAVQNEIDRRLLEAAAKAEGKELQAYLASKVEAAVGEPTDAEIQAFYDKHKSPEAPPLELVRDQVKTALTEEKTNTVLGDIVATARKGATISQNLPDVRPPPFDFKTSAQNPIAGPEDAAVEVVEFSDFECPYCSRAADTLSKLKERYPERVRFVFRHFPLSFHPQARPAAEHAHCAHEQGKFWAFHDQVFAAQRELSVSKLEEIAGQIGLDQEKFKECLSAGRGAAQVTEDLRVGGEVGVGGTPSFYINGRPFTGNPNVDGLSQAIDAELARAAGS